MGGKWAVIAGMLKWRCQNGTRSRAPALRYAPGSLKHDGYVFPSIRPELKITKGYPFLLDAPCLAVRMFTSEKKLFKAGIQIWLGSVVQLPQV